MNRHDRKWMRALGGASCLLVFALTPWVGTALAAEEGDEALAVEAHAPTPAELDALLKDPNLSEEDRETLLQAAQEYEHGELRLRETGLVERPTLLGAPDGVTGGLTGTSGDRPTLGGGGEISQKDLTAEEKALMEKVDSRAHELEAQGLSEKEIHELIEREMGSELREAAEKHGIEHEKGDWERYREMEYAPREVESHPVESTREPTETERSYESPTVERSTESTTIEREYEKPPMEYEGMPH